MKIKLINIISPIISGMFALGLVIKVFSQIYNCSNPTLGRGSGNDHPNSGQNNIEGIIHIKSSIRWDSIPKESAKKAVFLKFINENIPINSITHRISRV
jgi:hypothetical protein